MCCILVPEEGRKKSLRLMQDDWEDARVQGPNLGKHTEIRAYAAISLGGDFAQKPGS